MTIRNEVIGQQTFIQGTVTGPATRNMILTDPDNVVQLYYAGTAKFATATKGARIYGDIVAADPPTTEKVEAQLDFYDSDGTTLIGQVGYLDSAASNELFLYSRFRGGEVVVSGLDSAGAFRYMLRGRPDTSTGIYYDGNETFRTHASGINVAASLNPFIAFFADLNHTTRTAFVQSTALSGYWRNEQTSSNMNISSWNSADAPVTHFDGDPDAGVTLYYQGFSRLTTTTSGATLLGSLSANSATFEASSGNTSLNIQKAAADDQGTVTYRNELGTQRYIFGMAGSTDDDFFIGRYNDSGVWQGSALYVDGITGQVDLR
jgi:hypothetical protein